MSWPRWAALISAVSLIACDRGVVAPDTSASGPRGGPQGTAVVEITFHDVGSPRMTSGALVASSVADIEFIRSRHSARLLSDLSVPEGSDVPAAIQLEPLSTGSVATAGFYYIHAMYRVRNARRASSTGFDTPRRNLTFVAVSTAGTIGDTPISVFTRADGTTADLTLARELIPTGLVTVDYAGQLQSLSPDVLQAFTEAEVAAVATPPGVTNIFPYGFVVRRAGSTTTRTLDPSPAPNQFDGVVTFAFRIPIQANPAENPTTISIMALGLDDSETRLTQSLEEQQLGARRASRDRAASLGVSARTLLPGGTFPVAGSYHTLCSVRTAGVAGAPTAHVVDVPSSFISLAPDPYAADGSGGFVRETSAFAATFTRPVTEATPRTLLVRGMQTGFVFRDASYEGNGTNRVRTPIASFFPGEELEFVVTTRLSCPNPQVGRLRIQAARATGSFGTARAFDVGRNPTALAAADIDRDGDLDIVVANRNSSTLSVLLGNGNGTFQSARTVGTPSTPSAVALADLDHDGNLDIAVATVDSVSILLGDGRGTFTSLPAAPPGGGASTLRDVRGLALADMNGDSIVDIVVTDLEGAISLVLGDGDGTFVARSASPAAAESFALAVGDLDTDGRLDVVAADANNKTLVLLGNGDGTVQGARTPPGESVHSIVLADVNRDGQLDLAQTNAGNDDVSVLLGNGDGTFQAPSLFAVGRRSPLALAAGDVNGDGRDDLVVGMRTDGVVVLLGNGDGTFERHQSLESNNPRGLVLADVNGDGILDVIVANDHQNGTVSVFLGR